MKKYIIAGSVALLLVIGLVWVIVQNEPTSVSGGKEVAMAKDPVCGMEVSKKGSPSTVHMGKTFYFKSEGCKSRFNEDPMKYMNN